MNKELIEAILQWESEYLRMSKNLTDREKEILKGDSIKSNEGMVFGRMYADWKKMLYRLRKMLRLTELPTKKYQT